MKIEGPLSIETVAEVHGRFIALLAAGDAAEVDLSAVGSVDAFGLQLLWSAGRSAAAREIPLKFLSPNDHLQRACVAAGIDSHRLLNP